MLDCIYIPFAELHNKSTVNLLHRESLTYQAAPPGLVECTAVWLDHSHVMLVQEPM